MKTTVYKIRLKRGDTVIVRSGKHKGQTGKITATHPRDNKVTVEGINVVKRHIKPNRQHPQGGVLEVTKPIWVSKVSLIDPASKLPSRLGVREKDGRKIRVLKRSDKAVQ